MQITIKGDNGTIITISVSNDGLLSDYLEAFTLALKAATFNYIEQVGALGNQGDLHVPTYADSMRWYSALGPEAKEENV